MAAPTDPPPSPAPATLVSKADGSTGLDLAGGRAITAEEAKALVTANAKSRVTIAGPGKPTVIVPAGTLAEGANVSGLLADVSSVRNGDVVVRIDADGSRHTVALSLVEDGQVTYVANAQGSYELVHKSLPFKDVSAHWAKGAIAFSSSRELTQGMTADRFEPDRPASRAMVLTLLARLEEAELPRSPAGGPWYAGAVSWAMSQGLSDGTRPDADIKREELVALLWRWSGQPDAGELTGFTDLWAVSPYARKAVAWAAENGILAGRTDASIDPHTGATRAETAVILQRFITYLVEQQAPRSE